MFQFVALNKILKTFLFENRNVPVSRLVISFWRRLNLYFFNVESLESNLI